MYTLHPQLAKDCIVIGHFNLSQLLLMNDCNYPWFILVPQRANISEIYQLSEADQAQLWHESAYLSEALARHFVADKMNIAALGNVVPQLHVHHIVRYRDDPAWPAPVWGKLAAVPYTDDELQHMLTTLVPVLGNHLHLA
ncbi:MAG: HIT domain-containing protein [Gammaproteobacteria bacterium]|nr:HIT domain-containing protein [Gammaproteobacteria bacterium]